MSELAMTSSATLEQWIPNPDAPQARYCDHGKKLNRTNRSGFASGCPECHAAQLVRTVCEHGYAMNTSNKRGIPNGCLKCRRAYYHEFERVVVVKEKKPKRTRAGDSHAGNPRCMCGHRFNEHEPPIRGRRETRGPCEVSLGGRGYDEKICACEEYVPRSRKGRKA